MMGLLTQVSSNQSLLDVRRPSFHIGTEEFSSDVGDMQRDQPLVDRFGRRHTYLRISVTDRCNLRCRYCMPSIPKNTLESQADEATHRMRTSDRFLTFDEIERISRLLACRGITKIRITGGEPLVRLNLSSLISRLASIPGIQNIGLTTNGVLLKAHLQDLRANGLTNLNISLDTLRADRFEGITLHRRLDAVLESIHAALAIRFDSLKLNVVVMGGVNDDEIFDFVDIARMFPIEVRFIEYMPFISNGWNAASFVSCIDIRNQIEHRYQLRKVDSEADPFQVARCFRGDGWRGSIGFIASMSDHFCHRCNRIRLTADGSLKSCLFYPAEMQLKSAIRNGATDEELDSAIRKAIRSKPFQHPPALELGTLENRAMIEIGG